MEGKEMCVWSLCLPGLTGSLTLLSKYNRLQAELTHGGWIKGACLSANPEAETEESRASGQPGQQSKTLFQSNSEKLMCLFPFLALPSPHLVKCGIENRSI